MSSLFTLKVDLDDLADAMYDFVVDPSPSRNERPIVDELSDLNHDLIDVLECMILDGTEDRADVVAFVDAVFGSHGSGPIKADS